MLLRLILKTNKTSHSTVMETNIHGNKYRDIQFMGLIKNEFT